MIRLNIIGLKATINLVQKYSMSLFLNEMVTKQLYSHNVAANGYKQINRRFLFVSFFPKSFKGCV